VTIQEATLPQLRKYVNRAAQQAAYRKRQAHAQQILLASKGLPALPAIPTMPSNARWQAMIDQAHTLLCDAAEEMQSYHDDRSEQWQEGDKAEELLARIEQVQEKADQLLDIE
jgi:hypothetical protein